MALGLALVLAPASGMADNGTAPVARKLFRLPAAFDGRVLTLEAMELRPRLPGPFPLAIIAHGTPGTEDKRRQYKVETFTPQAMEFARRGFVAVAFLRRGYGTSEGRYAESNGACGRMNYLDAGIESARDIAAAIRALGNRPDIDRSRVLVVGQSAGGFAALALMRDPPPGVLGIVNFAGGRGHFAERNAVCEPEKLVAAAGQFGRGAQLPGLWIYAENDKSFGPGLARQMLNAYLAGGGRAEMVMTPPYGEDGHFLFALGLAEWRQPVDEFLRRMRLPTLLPQPRAVPPPEIRGKVEDAFRKYAESLLPNKAFAASARGAYAWKSGARSVEAARTEALTMCQQRGAACSVIHEVNDFEDE
ncbi:MAG: alpha/beta hydrolase family protein [Rhodospirillales bacterium]